MISDLPNQLCVNTYRTFHSETIYIDGGMSADPYQIARYARMYELDQQEALANVRVSRAFTVYQLSNILHDNLETIIESLRPRTLILGMFPALYHDPDVSSQEAQALFARDLEKIKELTIKYNLITILTDHDTAIFPNHRGLGKILSTSVNEIVRMKKHEQFTSIDLVNKQASATILHFARGQIRLEEFGMAV